MNILHLHLTDDQGWRLQIDKYPKLVSIGSNLKDKEGKINPGFYTKEDIRDIVAYAAKGVSGTRKKNLSIKKSFPNYWPWRKVSGSINHKKIILIFINGLSIIIRF